jgi:hypothetical protein
MRGSDHSGNDRGAEPAIARSPAPPTAGENEEKADAHLPWQSADRAEGSEEVVGPGSVEPVEDSEGALHRANEALQGGQDYASIGSEGCRPRGWLELKAA